MCIFSTLLIVSDALSDFLFEPQSGCYTCLCCPDASPAQMKHNTILHEQTGKHMCSVERFFKTSCQAHITDSMLARESSKGMVPSYLSESSTLFDEIISTTFNSFTPTTPSWLADQQLSLSGPLIFWLSYKQLPFSFLFIIANAPGFGLPDNGGSCVYFSDASNDLPISDYAENFLNGSSLMNNLHDIIIHTIHDYL